MLIKALTLENFKGIREPVRIEFAPITLLFGPNNAGKSTVIQALMYAREILEKNNCDAKKTQLGGDAVDLGGFLNIVHGHDLNRVVRMRFELDQTDADFLQGFSQYIDPSIGSMDSQEANEDPRKKAALDFVSNRSHVWVEIHVACDENIGPHVSTYSIGDGVNAYATIRHNPSSKIVAESNASLEIDFTYPGFARFGTTVIDNPILTKIWNNNVENQENIVDSWLSSFLLECVSPDFYPITKKSWFPIVDASGLALKTALPPLKETFGLSWCARIDNTFEKNGEKKISTDKSYNYLSKIISEVVVTPAIWLAEQLSDSAFLSAQREKPPRIFIKKETTESSWWDGYAAWNSLISSDDKAIARVNAWLNNENRFDSRHVLELTSAGVPNLSESTTQIPAEKRSLGHEVLRNFTKEIDKLPMQRNFFLRNTRSGIPVYACDVGAGLAQIIPIIVAALDPRLSFVSIEEPEAKLHPRFQVALADLLISSAISRLSNEEVSEGLRSDMEEFVRCLKEEGKDVDWEHDSMLEQLRFNYESIRGKPQYKKWFLVETHSEYLLLRCLRRIRESVNYLTDKSDVVLRPEDIAIHFIEDDGNGPRIYRIRIDEEGEFLDPWPQGFYPERGREIFGDDS